MATSDVQEKAAQVASEHRQWIEWAGRFGFATKGVVYGIVGALAVAAAWGGGRASGSKDAIREIGQQPFGQTLLWLTAAGLAGYALWRFVQAAIDPEHRHEKTDAKQIVRRVGFAVSGVIHLGLAIYAAPISFGSGSRGGSERGWVSWLLTLPAGQWIVGAVGLAVIGFALFELYSAFSQRFMKDYKVHEMNDTERKTAKYAGVLGLTARGVTFFIVGFFVIAAAINFNPNEVKNFAEALGVLASQPYGPWLLALAGVGLVGYAIYCGTMAFYRRFAIH